MATKLTAMKVSMGIADRIRKLKTKHGTSLGRLQDTAWDHVLSGLEAGTLVIQNGKIIPAPQEAPKEAA